MNTPRCASRRRRTAFLLPSDRDDHDERHHATDRDDSDGRDEQTSEGSRRSEQPQLGPGPRSSKSGRGQSKIHRGNSGLREGQGSYNTVPYARGMRTRILGRTGLKVSEIGFGAWAIGGNAHGNSYGPTDDTESVATVRHAIDLGVNFFDTADVYGWGHSEEILGEALSGRRDGVHIATKVGGDFYHGGVRMNFEPGYIAFALERSPKRLRTDHIAGYPIPNPPAEMMGDPETYEVLEALKAEHKIDHYGVSVHEPSEAAR